jgi:anti-sigma B factor antagonist
MNVVREDHSGAALFIVQGQVDMHTSPTLRGHLRKALEGRARSVVVDLSGVAFIDSSGLATLIETLQTVSKYGGRLQLVGLSPAVTNLFRLSNLTSIFDIKASRDDALPR